MDYEWSLNMKDLTYLISSIAVLDQLAINLNSVSIFYTNNNEY